SKLLENPRYFEELIQKLFLDNIHRATLTVRPDRKLTEQWAKQDAERASRIGEIAVTEEPTEGTGAVVQKLKIADLPRQGLQIERSFEDGVWCYPIARRELCSASLTFNISHIPTELLPYLQVYGATFGEFYAESLPGVLGELSSAFHTAESPTGMPVGRLILSGTGFNKDGAVLLDTIAQQALVDPATDRRRLIQLMVEQKARFEAEIQEDAAAYCDERAKAKLRATAAISEHLQGIAAFDNLRLLISEAKKNWGSFSEKMTAARTLLFAHADPLWSLTAAPKVLNKLSRRATDLSKQFGPTPADPTQWLPSNQPLREGFTVPSQVASTAVTFDLRAAGYQHHGSLNVLLKLIEHARLWPEIRQRNGAYNYLIDYNSNLGLLTVGSRYDSRPEETIAVAEKIPEWLEEMAPKIRQLRRSKIGAIGEIDRPCSKAERAEADFLDRLSGWPPNTAEKERAEVFEAQAEHCLALAQVLARARTLPWAVATIGSRRDLERLNQHRGGDFLATRPLEPRASEQGSTS
ncbi:MAG: hypothetical protein EBZ48_10205, partial [Proteobacteria bacterium]|nr:hypothetical protein [Pseudomonadota bacterium]